MEPKTLGRVTSVHDNPVCSDHFARKERRWGGGGLLFVEGSVIGSPQRFKNKLLLCMNILDPPIPCRTSTIQLCNM